MESINYVVPDLKDVTNCSYYWGNLGHIGAKQLLKGKPEGTFLLRDSAQEEYLYTVSVSTGNRTNAGVLNVRIEHWNNNFCFGKQGYQSPTVTGLIQHYRTNSCGYFLDCILTYPLHRNSSFDLKCLARAALGKYLTRDFVDTLELPGVLKTYLMEYHCKQKALTYRPVQQDGFVSFDIQELLNV